MTTYRVVIEIEVEGPEWPYSVQVPRRLKDWDQHLLDGVMSSTAQALIDKEITLKEIEVVFE
jgi:hypothetical protein